MIDRIPVVSTAENLLIRSERIEEQSNEGFAKLYGAMLWDSACGDIFHFAYTRVGLDYLAARVRMRK